MFNTREDRRKAIEALNKYSDLNEYLLRKTTDKFKKLRKLIVADCDGILSTNESMYSKDGKMMKSYGCYDKEMIRLLEQAGWSFVFVSADKAGFEITKARCIDIKEILLFANAEERKNYIDKVRSEYDLIVFIGDSLSDIPSLAAADYSGTVATAPDEVQMFCDYVSSLKGGYGGFADIIWRLHNLIQKEYKYKQE